jgi:8-oxo-dGTP pyrophosphatase MutT (NUDIX family)
MYENKFPTKTPRKVRALLFDEYEQIVLLGRDKPNELLYYVTAGGKVEKGESKVDALRRELREELDATVVIGRPFFTILDTTYYPVRLLELGPNPFTGPEFAKEKNGRFFIEAFGIDDVIGHEIDLQPYILPDLLRHYEGAIREEVRSLA